MKWFEDFIKWLKDALQWFKDLFEATLNTLLDLLKDLFYWLFTTVIDLAVGFFNTITDGNSWDLTQYITALPPEIRSALGALGFGNCMAIIGTALLIRFLMGLVPFIRLGR